ncbi:M14 family metallopeptidase [Rheinheimera pleomorphica]|uniref:M14 family metallopeptidase n=1 Tax=Rheinheimera pleomorphica TaxID=2703963 RepID=UPI00141E1E6A|nr:M14-type cytosolic carboxypeptidase [Rheinheimera pleomorphica]
MVKVSSDFDGGAISIINVDNADNIQLGINKDNQSCTRQWFYFAVESISATLQRIRLVNADKVSFSGAWDGYQAFASYDNQSWFRIDTQYQNGELVLTLEAKAQKVYYAYFVPYPLTRQTALLQHVAAMPAAQLKVLGQTAQGRDITLLRIGSASAEAKKIWLIARQHPGETMAQWIAEGVILQLAEHFAANFVAHSTKQHANSSAISFYIVANMNPDGAALGNHRTNANGINLNRHWATPDPLLCPEVYLVKQAMLKYGVDAFIDIHGDETLPYNFMQAEAKHPFADQLKQALAELDSNFQTKYDYSNFDVGCGAGSCGSSCGQQKATSFVQQQFGVASILLEASFKPLQQADQTMSWDNEAAKQLGANLARGLVDQYHHLNQT